jgi:hypothetical protein
MTPNHELRALSAFVRTLEKLDPAARHRVLSWAWDRYVRQPSNQVEAMAAGLRHVSSVWRHRRAS